MSSFEKIFLPERSKKKKSPQHSEKSDALPSHPRVNQPRKPKTAQIEEGKLSSIVGHVLEEKFQALTETLEKQAISQAAQLPEELLNLQMHVFNRDNLILFIGSCGLRGTKLYKLKFFFHPTPASTIAEELDHIKSEGLLQSNRNGWMSLTNTSP